MDGPTDGPTDGQTDKASYRVACPRLKSILQYFTDRHCFFVTIENKAGFTANLVACGWARAVIEVTGAFGQEQ